MHCVAEFFKDENDLCFATLAPHMVNLSKQLDLFGQMNYLPVSCRRLKRRFTATTG